MSLLAIGARRRAGAAQPLPVGGSPGTYSRTDTGIRWLAEYDGTAYGVTSGNTWATTTNATTYTDTGVSALYGGKHVIDLLVTSHGYYLHTTGALDAAGVPSGTGAIWRGPSLDSMVNITPPSGWLSGTCGRPSMLAHDGTTLLVGMYAYASPYRPTVWRTTDEGQTWAYWNATESDPILLPQARHAHAVHFDPTVPGRAWMTIGESAYGLFRSDDSGATWTWVAKGEYGIDMRFMSDGYLVSEGDGINRPHLIGYTPGQVSDQWDDLITPAMASALTGQTDWRGTTRGIHVLPDQRVFYTTTAEEGAVGTRWGIWLATRGTPWTMQLLEELPSRWMVMGKTLQVGARLLCYRSAFTLPGLT